MKVTVAANEPLILRDAKPGDVFLVHTPTKADGIFTLIKASYYAAPTNHYDIVCVGCRVGITDRTYITTGTVFCVDRDTPITLLDQVEPAAFRSRPTAVRDTVRAPSNQAQPEFISRL